MKARLGGRVIVHGPIFPNAVAALVTRVHEDGTIDATAFPPGSTTGLCLNAIEPLPDGLSVGEPRTFYFTPAAPEPLAIEIGMREFVDVLKPMIVAAVEDYAGQEDPDGTR